MVHLVHLYLWLTDVHYKMSLNMLAINEGKKKPSLVKLATAIRKFKFHKE